MSVEAVSENPVWSRTMLCLKTEELTESVCIKEESDFEDPQHLDVYDVEENDIKTEPVSTPDRPPDQETATDVIKKTLQRCGYRCLTCCHSAYGCLLCPFYRSFRYIDLQRHIFINHTFPEETEIFKCTECDFDTESCPALLYHMDEVHQFLFKRDSFRTRPAPPPLEVAEGTSRPKVIRCPVCSSMDVLISEDDLQQHYYRHHKPRQQPVKKKRKRASARRPRVIRSQNEGEEVVVKKIGGEELKLHIRQAFKKIAMREVAKGPLS